MRVRCTGACTGVFPKWRQKEYVDLKRGWEWEAVGGSFSKAMPEKGDSVNFKNAMQQKNTCRKLDLKTRGLRKTSTASIQNRGPTECHWELGFVFGASIFPSIFSRLPAAAAPLPPPGTEEVTGPPPLLSTPRNRCKMVAVIFSLRPRASSTPQPSSIARSSGVLDSSSQQSRL